MASQGGRVTGLHGVSLSLGVGPTRIYGGGDGHEEPWAPRRLGVGERRERRDEDGRRRRTHSTADPSLMGNLFFYASIVGATYASGY